MDVKMHFFLLKLKFLLKSSIKEKGKKCMTKITEVIDIQNKKRNKNLEMRWKCPNQMGWQKECSIKGVRMLNRIQRSLLLRYLSESIIPCIFFYFKPPWHLHCMLGVVQQLENAVDSNKKWQTKATEISNFVAKLNKWTSINLSMNQKYTFQLKN